MVLKISVIILLVVTLPSHAEDSIQVNTCKNLKSCYSCLSHGSCVWCVNKSKCTTDSCGNDNVIYPGHVRALMAGSQFCPRVVLPGNRLIIQSGKPAHIVVKITHIYMYMAFTPWKCKINLDGKEVVTNAVLLADEVYCESVVLNNESSRAHANGSVSVLWEYSKAFDGSLPITVCRCDLDPTCVACGSLISYAGPTQDGLTYLEQEAMCAANILPT